MSYININLQDLAELKSRRGSPTTGVIATVLGLNYPIVEAYSVYLWVESSTATPDNVEVVASDLGDPNVGRWIRIDLSTPPPINADWNATSGPAMILNKPTLFSGNYADLTGKPSLFSGAYADLSGKPTFATVATSGSYNDLANKPTIPTIQARSFANPTRPLNTAFQVSASRDALVVYTVDISVTSLLLAGASGRVYLEYADDSAFTTNVVTTSSSPNATGGVLNVTNLGAGNVVGMIPAGKFARIRTQNVAGTPTFTFQGSQEVLL
jgi:hypothetical protein